MKNSYFLAGCLGILFLWGCSSSDDGGGVVTTPIGDLILEGIVGQWEATSASFTTVNANPVLTRDVVADGGFCDFSIAQDHRFSQVIRNPGEPNPQITTGILVSEGEFINVKFDTDPTTEIRWEFGISGDNLSVSGPLDYDFESDGTFEEASAVMQFIRS